MVINKEILTKNGFVNDFLELSPGSTIEYYSISIDNGRYFVDMQLDSVDNYWIMHVDDSDLDSVMNVKINTVEEYNIIMNGLNEKDFCINV